MSRDKKSNGGRKVVVWCSDSGLGVAGDGTKEKLPFKILVYFRLLFMCFLFSFVGLLSFLGVDCFQAGQEQL